MLTGFRGPLFAAAAVGVFSIAALPAVGQAPPPAGRGTAPAPYRAPRAADGHADLSGIWQAMNSANWNLQDHPAYAGPMWETGAIGAAPAGQGVVQGNEIPYLPAKLAQKKQNFENRRTDDRKPNATWVGSRGATTSRIPSRSCNPRPESYSFTNSRVRTGS